MSDQTNPFASEITTAQRRVDDEARQAELDREAAAERRRAAVRAHEAAAMRRQIQAAIDRFKDGFYHAVRTRVIKTDRMAPKTIEQIGAYYTWLTTTFIDRDNLPEEPYCPIEIKRKLQDKFAYGIYLSHVELPEGCMIGQLQPWCSEQVNNLISNDKDEIDPLSGAKIRYSTGGAPARPKADAKPTEVVTLRPAITPAGKSPKKRQSSKAS